MKILWLVLLGLWTHVLGAEDKPATPAVPALPGNEILLYDIKSLPDGLLKLEGGQNITQQPGYDSQPKFSADGQFIFYTHAVMTDTGFQMDIWQHDLNSGKNQPYLVTAESEYSPTPLLHGPGLSVVQVDAAGDQYVVLLNNQAEPGKQSKRHSDLKQVGYFNWTQGGHLWSFVLNEHNGGDLYRQGPDMVANKLADNVGRAFITDATAQTIHYVDMNTTPHRIHRRTAKDTTATDVMPLPMGVEDFTLDSQGRFWAGRDNTLFVSTDQRRWYIVHEFNDPNLHQITRLTTNPAADRIAIVFAEKTAAE
ncbi:TolB family protein [Marinicella meishanensis]|uniref:TolB family protein n=1 Tax=Marinicella meishanensis TaxID=2873263 RepID=UPI001CBF686C|nr:hypothetical protein [Marinicella sp. NBU2979]